MLLQFGLLLPSLAHTLRERCVPVARLDLVARRAAPYLYAVAAITGCAAPIPE